MSIVLKNNNCSTSNICKSQFYKYFKYYTTKSTRDITTGKNDRQINVNFKDTEEYRTSLEKNPDFDDSNNYKSTAKLLKSPFVNESLIESAKKLPSSSSPLSDLTKRNQYESLMRSSSKEIIGKGKKHLYEFSTDPIDPNEFFKKVPFSIQAAYKVLDRMGLCGHHDKVLQMIDYLEKKIVKFDIVAYSNSLSALANCKDIDNSLLLFKKLLDEGIQPNGHIFNSLIRVHMYNGLVEEGITILNSMESIYNLIPDHVNYTSVIHGCVENKKYDMSLQIFSEARNKGLEPDAVTLSVMINACAKIDRVEKAFTFYDEFEYLDLKPTEVTFNTLINACAKRSDDYYYLKAFELLQEMDLHGYKPDIITYTSLLNGAAKRGEIPVVEKIFNELLHNRKDFKQKPDERIFTTVIMAYANNQIQEMKTINKSGLGENIEKANKVFKQMEKRNLKIDSRTLDSLLRVYTKAHRVNLAKEFFDTKYQQYNTKHTIQSYHILIKMLMNNKRFEDGLQYFEKMKTNGIDPDYGIYLEILHGTTKFGYAKTCLKFVKEMHQKGFPPIYNDIKGILKRYADYPEITDGIKSLTKYSDPKHDPVNTVLFYK